MDWFRRFMAGRYGGDRLSIYLLVFSMILTFGGQLLESRLLVWAGYLPLALAVYRMFSKDTRRRSMENYKFAIFISPLYARVKGLQGRLKDRKHHKYYRCTQCGTTLRVPRGRGKLLITCPGCQTKFTKKT